MTTTSTGIAATTPDRQVEDRVDAASRQLYDAECQFHAAHHSGVDAWTAAAGDHLHRAVQAYLAAAAAAQARPR